MAIAHRLTTIKDSDKILVMKAGRVVETGKHTDLVKREVKYETDAEGHEEVVAGFYHKQWDTQFQESDTSVRRIREKIQELQYQITVHQGLIDEAYHTNIDRFQPPALKPRRLDRSASTLPGLPPLAMGRGVTAPANPDDLLDQPPQLGRATSAMVAHNQIFR